jgi:HlyD family secretion protein
MTRGQSAQMPALLEFYSPSAALIETKVQTPARGVIWTVSSMFVACAVAAAVIPIDKVVSASSKVVTTDGPIVVQPLDASIIRKILVVSGQRVHKGQLLAELDPTLTTSDKTATTLAVASLRAEVERRKAEAAGVDYHPSVNDAAAQLQEAIFAQRHLEYTMQMESYQQQIDSLKGALDKAIADVKVYGDRLQVAQEVEGKRRELEQLGWGSQLNRLQAQDSRLDLQREVQEAQQTAKSAANDLQSKRADMLTYQHNRQSQNASDLSDAQRKLDQAQGDLTKAELHSQLVDVKAETDGTVQYIAPVSVGSVLQPGDQLMKIVPVDAPLEVEGNVIGSEIGYVRVGEPVTIKFDTLPFIHYGTATGEVRVVSPDSYSSLQPADTINHGIADPDADTTKAPAPGQAYYKVRISIDKVNLHDLPKGFRIVPGLPVSADILVGKRTVMSYILSRALPTAYDGMREP